jgi:two-component system, cell cycle sensor histidine kinase and response regulator CckA
MIDGRNCLGKFLMKGDQWVNAEGGQMGHGVAEKELDWASPSSVDSPEHFPLKVSMLLQNLESRRSELEEENKELRATKGRLEAALARYADLYDFAPVGYVTMASDSSVLEANITLAADLSVDRDSLVGLMFRKFVAAEHHALLDDFLDEICRSGNRQKCELRLDRADGTSFWGLIQSNGLKDAENRLVCRASIMDITSRKETEEAVCEQRNLLKKIFSEMPGLHSLKDCNFNYQYVNPAFHQFLGRKEEEILGRTDLELLPLQKARKYRKEDIEVVESGQPLVLEENVSTPLFGKKWLQVTKIPIKDQEGRVAGIISSINDITERKKMENELLKMQKLESVGVLAGGIAHDFNNLLTGILGNIELAKMYVGPESKAHPRLVQAENASLAAKNLTRQLLTFSRGGAPVTKTASVAELVRDSTEFTLRGSNIRVLFELPTDLWLAEIDEGQISQVIQNLVKNADQAMPEGGTLEIRVRNTKLTKKNGLPLKAGCYLEVSVKDNGQGIPEKIQGRIFDPYFTTKPQGSGLGLAVCYSIIKQHMGHLDVDSQPGIGTTFRFFLPASCRAAAGENPPPEMVLTGHGRVLVMDDDDTVREIAGEMLRVIGYDVDFAADGLEAVKSWIRARRLGKPFTAVLMDLTVRGGMGGREAAGKLLELDPEVKVIAASGYATDPVMTDYRHYGFSGAVHKPFRIQELSGAFLAVLEVGVSGSGK